MAQGVGMRGHISVPPGLVIGKRHGAIGRRREICLFTSVSARISLPSNEIGHGKIPLQTSLSLQMISTLISSDVIFYAKEHLDEAKIN